jgi:hypothetical protein
VENGLRVRPVPPVLFGIILIVGVGLDYLLPIRAYLRAVRRWL